MIAREPDQTLQGDDLDRLPSTSECTVHLQLMTAFSYLKEDVTETKDLFFQDQLLSNDTAKLSDARWTIFVTRAASRYEKWFLNLAKKQSIAPLRANVLTSQTKLDKYLAAVKPLHWTADMLPPLDVLMVLHAAMLNPRWFAEDCLRHGMMSLWKAGMPWSLISECIDQSTLEYKPPTNAVSTFESLTGLSWNNLDDAEAKLFICTICDNNTIPDADNLDIENWISSEECTALYSLPCRKQDHLEQLKIARLQNDLQTFHTEKTPLRGTILTDKGLIQSDSALRPQRDFCARLLSSTPPPAHQPLTTYFATLNSTPKSRLAKRNPLSSHPTPCESYTLTRTTLSYTESSSPLSIDLAAAVLRQGTFISQMRSTSWTFAPPSTLPEILSDILDRYEIFLHILRSSAVTEFSVPTLAVDLAWHTHQLSPARYYTYNTKVLGSAMFDHDDRVGEGDLGPAFERTSKKYEVLSGGLEYSECLCWVCAAGNQVGVSDENEKLGEGKVDERVREIVGEAQMRKFEHDYARALRRRGACDRGEFAKGYAWLFPEMAPKIAVG